MAAEKALPRGSGPRPARRGWASSAGVGHEVDEAEAAGVVEGEAGAVVEVEDDVVVLLRRRVRVVEGADRGAGDEDAAGHAEVDDQGLAPVEVGEEVLGAAAQGEDAGAGEAGGEARGEGAAEVGAADVGAGDDVAGQHGLEAAADGLDLGQLGQGDLRFRAAAGRLRGRFGGRAVAAARACLIRRRGSDRKPEAMPDDATTTGARPTSASRPCPRPRRPGGCTGCSRRSPARYDLMNDAMSLGVHRLWKDAMLDWLAPRPGMRLLDVAGGTGDIAFRFLRRVKGDGQATVLDMTEDMLTEGRRRAEATTFADRLDWVVGDAMALPFPDASFDAYTISFGIRNVTRIEDALAEAFRVLRPGGRLLVLEFSQVPERVAAAGSTTATRSTSSRRWGRCSPGTGRPTSTSSSRSGASRTRRPSPEMIGAAGFEQVRYRNLSMGIAALHSGWKL